MEIDSNDTAAPIAKCPFSKVGSEFNPFYGPQLADPYSFYARARREEPVFFSAMLGMWYVTRYDDVAAVLKDPVRYSSAGAFSAPLDYTAETRHAVETSFMSASTLTDLDPPAHTPIRRLVNKAFAERQVDLLEARIRAIANDLIDRFARAGRADFVRVFSFPFPMRVILSVIGAPEDDLHMFKQWADDWITLVTTQLDPEQQAAVVGRLLDSQQYWANLIEEKRAHPRDDLLSDLVRAAREETSLTRLRLINICAILVLAGHETTTNLLGNCLYRTLSDPDQWRLVREDPRNIPRAIEETLRADTSVQALMRTTTEDAELGGVLLPKGARLALLFASANHDEAYFPDGARFDVTREDPRGHLAFGQGTHFCVGAPLARMEGRIALELLVKRLPDLKLTPGLEPAYVANPIHRYLKELQIEWSPSPIA